MFDQDDTAIQQDAVQRALIGDPSSVLYGPSMREALPAEDLWKYNPAGESAVGSNVMFLVGCCAFLIMALLFW